MTSPLTTPVEALTVGHDTLIALEGVTDHATGAVVTTATVTHTLRDASGAVLDLDRPCLHDTGGTYRATIPGTLPLVVGRAYVGTYVVVDGPNVTPFRVDYRAVPSDA